MLLTGNAFAVHDMEKSILKTSLGICQMSGRAVEGGSRNHLFAINAVNRRGGIRPAVESGLLTSGVMYECVRRPIPFVLAGSIRDDGPLKDVVTDVVAAQKAYVEALEGCGMCLMLASALHAIAVGNLLPARVRTVVRGHDRVGAGQAVESRHDAGDRPRDRRGLLPRPAGRRTDGAGDSRG